MSKIYKVCLFSILISCSLVLSYVDKIISSVIFLTLPGIKIGFANIIMVFILYNYGFKEGLLAAILKAILNSFFLYGISSFMIGGIATIISYFTMYLVKKSFENKLSIISISIVGGISHSTVQIININLIYNIGNSIYFYFVYIMIISFFSSILIGFIVVKMLNNMYNIKKQLN